MLRSRVDSLFQFRFEPLGFVFPMTKTEIVKSRLGVRRLNNIELSTAAFCLWDLQPEEKLRISRQLNFKKIEIALSTASMVKKFMEVMDHSAIAEEFEDITLHAPWHGIAYGNNAKSEKLISQLVLIAERLRIKSVIVHCDCIRDPEVLEATGLPIALENTATAESLECFSRFLEAYPWKISLNLNKASREHGQLDRILECWHHRIERIHLSGHVDNRGRMPLLRTDQLHLLEKIQDLIVPLVLEGLFPPGNLTSIVEERHLVQSKLKC